MTKKHSIVNRSLTVAMLLIVAASLTGCHFGGPRIPAGWNGEGTSLASIDNRGDEARLQVIIGYGAMFPNHAAMRISCPGREVLFWDPGGNFSEKNPKYERRCNLVFKDPPNIKRYLAYRWKNCHDVGVEVFEWDITPQYAIKLQDTLINGINADRPPGTFSPSAMYMECSLSVSRYLKEIASDMMTVNTEFLPNKLAAELYTQSPDRVFVFRRKQTPQVYTLNDE